MTTEVKVLPLIPNIVKLDNDKFLELYETFGYQLCNYLRVFYGNENDNTLVVRDFVVISQHDEHTQETQKVFFDIVKSSKEEHESSEYSDDMFFAKTNVGDYYKLQVVTEDIPSQAIIISLQQDTTTEPVTWSLTFMDMYTLEQIKVDGTLEELLPTVTDPNSDNNEQMMLNHLAYLYGYNLEINKVYVPIIHIPSANQFSSNANNGNEFKWVRMGDALFSGETVNLSGHKLNFNDFGDKGLGYFNWDDKITITGITRCSQEVIPLIENILTINRKHITTTIEEFNEFDKMFDHMQVALESRAKDLEKPATIAVDIYFEQHDKLSLQLCVKGYFREVPLHNKFNNQNVLLLQDDIVYPTDFKYGSYDTTPIEQWEYNDKVNYKMYPNEALVIEIETENGPKLMVNGVLKID